MQNNIIKMNRTLKTQKQNLLLLVMLLLMSICYSQREVAKWKLQFAVGVNHPFADGFVDDVYAKSLNIPTVNLGLQHMFSQTMGAKLDIGYNRFKNGENAPEFKTNYTRVNAQFVYDPSLSLGFLPPSMRVVLHAGPGISFVKPLGNLSENNTTFLNGLIGGELHYSISEKMSIYVDGSYVFGFSGKDLTELSNGGLGAFNGNMIYATIGISVSLSGCYYCD